MIEEREANLQGILESVNESIWSLDKNLEILFTNKTFFEEFFQYSGIELTKGINILNSIPDPSEREKWRKRYETVLESGSPLHISDVLKIRNEKYHYESVVYPLKVNDRVEGVSVFSKNVTEKVDLDETSKLYRSLFETSTNEIFLISSESFQIKQANQAALKNTGYSIEEIVDISFIDLISKLTKEMFLEKVYPVISKKVPSVFLETSNLRKDGSSYDTEILLQWFTYDGEEFLSAFVSDISERKENQRALKESELRFTQIFKENVTPMLIIDPMSGQIEDANPAAISYYGFDPDSIKSKNVIDVNYTFKENPEKMVSTVENIMAQGKGKFEFVHKLQSGELRSVEVFCSKISINNRDLVHEIIQDVTERNDYYEALLKQNEALKEIAWIQSHIIRAPLAKIMGLVQILQDDKDDEDFSFDFILDAILNAANELDEVIQKTSEKSNQAKHLF
jgi:PAS domain S-box-containing protein